MDFASHQTFATAPKNGMDLCVTIQFVMNVIMETALKRVVTVWMVGMEHYVMRQYVNLIVNMEPV